MDVLNGSEKEPLIKVKTATKGLRFNEGKLRYDLIHPEAEKGLVKVLTAGSQKYAERNWEKGMEWSKVIASAKRHLAKIELGEDYDEESGLLHADHLQCNAHFLSAYYRIAPHYDDRQHTYLAHPPIGLDIDDVICNWVEAWCEKHGHCIPENWMFSYKNKERFENLGDELDEFYLNLPPAIKPSDIPFEPHCYITSRSVPVELTREWIEKHQFPTAPVYSVGFGESKVEIAKESGIEWFIDDRFENFVELNNAGVCTFLLDKPHNRRYNVGYKRIKDFKDFKERFL